MQARSEISSASEYASSNADTTSGRINSNRTILDIKIETLQQTLSSALRDSIVREKDARALPSRDLAKIRKEQEEMLRACIDGMETTLQDNQHELNYLQSMSDSEHDNKDNHKTQHNHDSKTQYTDISIEEMQHDMWLSGDIGQAWNSNHGGSRKLRQHKDFSEVYSSDNIIQESTEAKKTIEEEESRGKTEDNDRKPSSESERMCADGTRVGIVQKDVGSDATTVTAITKNQQKRLSTALNWIFPTASSSNSSLPPTEPRYPYDKNRFALICAERARQRKRS